MTRVAQALMVLAAAALWGASRLPWVDVASSDGLGPPRTTTLVGAAWASALVPLALLVLAAAVAALAVRGWPLRLLALLVAAASAAMGYLGIALWAASDVAVRAANLARVPVAALVGTQRHPVGAALCVVAAVGALAGATLLRSARTDRGASGTGAGRYAAPAARRAAARTDDLDGALSERTIWDALDEGRDPTSGDESDEGR